MNIGKYTTLEKLCKSQAAQRHDIDNIPDAIQLSNLKELVENVYDPLCNHFNRAIPISSGFRSKVLNSIIGGAKNSQHATGQAIDLDCDGDGTPITNNAVFYWLFNNVEFDQLIWEFGDDRSPSWVHVSFNSQGNRKQVLRAFKGGRYETYQP
jgi:zinc D-Ala-D-Ala carboxypeptidase